MTVMTTREEEELKMDLMEAHSDALHAGDHERARELRKQIILYPETAMHLLRSMGKKRLLATEYNLSAANEAFGEGWLDAKPQSRRFR